MGTDNAIWTDGARKRKIRERTKQSQQPGLRSKTRSPWRALGFLLKPCGCAGTGRGAWENSMTGDGWLRGGRSVSFSAPLPPFTLTPRASSQRAAGAAGSFPASAGGAGRQMGATDWWGRPSARARRRRWASGSGRSPSAGSGRGREAHLRPRAGSGSRSLHPGGRLLEDWAWACAVARGGSRPCAEAALLRRGLLAEGLRPRVFLPTSGWLKTDVTVAAAAAAHAALRHRKLGTRRGSPPWGAPRPLAPSSLPSLPSSLVEKACQPQPQPSPFSSPILRRAPLSLHQLQAEFNPRRLLWAFVFAGGDVGARGIALQLSFPEMFEGTSRVFIPPSGRVTGSGFRPCHSAVTKQTKLSEPWRGRATCYSWPLEQVIAHGKNR